MQFFFGWGGSAEKIRVSLKSDKNSGHFMWRPIYIFNRISLSSSYNDVFQTKVIKKIKTHILFVCVCVCVFFNLAIDDRMLKNIVESTGHRWQFVAFTVHAGYLRLQTHTFGIYNTYCSSTVQLLHKCTSLLRDMYIACLLWRQSKQKGKWV